MKKNKVALFRRPNGQYFMYRYNITTMGVNLASPPFIYFPPDRINDVPIEVAKLLAISSVEVPHPKVFNQMDPLYELAGCRNWKQFAKNALLLHIEQIEGGDVTIIPMVRDGPGFKAVRDASVHVPRSRLEEALLKVLSDLIKKK